MSSQRTPQTSLPGSVLYTCNLNAVRSPIAEALTKHLYGKRFFAESAGLEPAERDPFAMIVMKEIGIDMAQDHPLAIEAIDIGAYDLVISMTPESYERVLELTKAQAVDVEFWPTLDPFAAGEIGSREQRLMAYRQLRDELHALLIQRFGPRDIAAQ